MGPLRGEPQIATVTATSPAPSIALKKRRPPRDIRRKKIAASIGNHALAIAIAVMFLAPFAFILATALMTGAQVLSPSLWPHPFAWHNFIEVIRLEHFWLYTYNTVLYATLSSVGTVISSVPVAYALSRMHWRGRQAVFILVLATLMLPSQVTIVPLYIIFVHLGWIGSLKPLIVPSFFGDAFSIFLLRQFFMTIPQELSDAARVDGGSEWQILTKVIVPLAKPGIAAVGLFSFLYAWNDFFNPVIYTINSTRTWTLAVALSQFTTVHRGVLFNLQMAASVLFMLPIIILFFFTQKVFIEGVTLTGVKG